MSSRITLTLAAAAVVVLLLAAPTAAKPTTRHSSKHGSSPPPSPATSCADLEKECSFVTSQETPFYKLAWMTLRTDLDGSVRCSVYSEYPDEDDGCWLRDADKSLAMVAPCPRGFYGASILCTEIDEGGGLPMFRLPAPSVQSYFQDNFCALPEVTAPAPGESHFFYFGVLCVPAQGAFDKYYPPDDDVEQGLFIGPRPLPMPSSLMRMMTTRTEKQEEERGENGAGDANAAAAAADDKNKGA